MNAEQVIQEKHKVEDKIIAFYKEIEKFIGETAILTARELEICLAKIIDLIPFAKSDSEVIQFSLKTYILNETLKKRAPGYKPSSLKEVVFCSYSGRTNSLSKRFLF